MTFDIITTQHWAQDNTNQQMLDTRMHYISTVRHQGLTDGQLTLLQPRTWSRSWLNLAAAADWTQFITELAQQYGLGLTVITTSGNTVINTVTVAVPTSDPSSVSG